MKQYLLGMYQPDGPTPPPEVLDRVMRDLGVINQDIKDAGGWVFSGGLHPASTATVLKLDNGRGGHHRRAVRRGARSTSAASGSSMPRISTPRSAGAAGSPR